MPVKARVAKDRIPQFSEEALELFVVLERMPKGSRGFKDGSRKLARLLDLTDAWWTGNHVNDRSRKPCHPDGYLAREDFFRCRAVRTALLAATGSQQEKGPTKVS
jgi:hypothetical protein